MAHDNLVLVMHPLGNHGPLFQALPGRVQAIHSTCDSADLGRCTREEVVNAYDNAVRYTDHVLARAIDFLRTQTTHDAAMIYVSDHGESLGEKGLFLHGVPYAIAPKEQTQVPMAMWLSPGYADSFALAPDCLRQRASLPATHDNLFHTVLGMLDVHRHPRPPPGPERCLQTISDTWLNADVNTDNIDPKYFAASISPTVRASALPGPPSTRHVRRCARESTGRGCHCGFCWLKTTRCSATASRLA